MRMEDIEMLDYILDYLEQKNVAASTQDEQINLERGIKRYLVENGIAENAIGEYYKQFLKAHLDLILPADLKSYFVNYFEISEINQIVLEFINDGKITDQRKKNLYESLDKLYRCGLDDKYIPITEVKQMLGKLS